jgi:hypothetical protein
MTAFTGWSAEFWVRLRVFTDEKVWSSRCGRMAGNGILVLSETVSFTAAVGSGSGERFSVQFHDINSYLEHGKRDANTMHAAG